MEKALVIARNTGGRYGEAPVAGRTDAQGHFALTLTGSRVDVRVEATGLAPAKLDGVRPGAPLSILLESGRPIEGIVRDAVSRQPVSGARVEARLGPGLTWEPEAGKVIGTSDAQGHFRLGGIGSGLYEVAARHAVYGRAGRPSVAAGSRVELFLVASASVTGVVTDSAGKPIARAVVRVEGEPWGDRESATRTDAKGRYEIAGIEPGAYRVIAQTTGLAPGFLPSLLLKARGELRADLVLGPGATLVGRLLGPQDGPVQGLVLVREIGGRTTPPALEELLRAQAEGDGRFRLEHVPVDAQVVLAQASRFAPKRVDLRAAERGLFNLGDVFLETGLTVSGRIHDKGGVGINEARISCFPRGGAGALETRSEGDGSFVLGGVVGQCSLSVSAPGFASFRNPVDAGGRLDITLSPGGTIRGQVVNEKGGPVDSYEVTAQPATSDSTGAGWAGKTVGNANGSFTLEDLAAGTYLLQVKAPDRAPSILSGVKLTAGASTDLGIIRLVLGGTIRGSVTDTQGAPVVGASIVAGSGFSGSGIGSQGSSDENGRFEIHGVTPGATQVVVRHSSYATGRVLVREVDPATGPAEVSVVLLQGGRLEGTVLARDPSSLQNLTVRLEPQNSDDPSYEDLVAFPVGPDGGFEVEHLSPGRLSALLMANTAPGRSSSVRSQTLDVQDEATTTVQFSLRDILVSGLATRNGLPLIGERVTMRDTSGGSYVIWYGRGTAAPPPSGPQRLTGMTGEDGSFELLVDAPGKYFARIESPGRKTGYPERPIEVPDADSTAVRLDFSGAPVGGLVMDRDLGGPITDARIWAEVKTPGPEGPTSGGHASSGSDGRFELNLDPGRYELVAGAAGYAETRTDLSVDANGVADLRLALAKGSLLKGRVVDPAGRAVEGVDVLAGGSDATSLADGSFEINDLSSEPCNVFAGSAVAGFGFRTGVTPGQGAVTLTLRPAGRVHILVRGTDGAPVQGASVALSAIGGAPFFSQISGSTDGGGLVALSLPAGAVEMEANKENLTGRGTVSLQEGGETRVEIRLQVASR